MKKILLAALLVAMAVAMVGAQGTTIRVLLSNHPYTEFLKPLIPEFERTYGVKVNLETYDENQLSAKLMTEFATRMSTVDVFMTRPLQEGKLMYLNGWYENLSPYLKDSKKTPRDFDFGDFAQSAVGVSTYAKNVYAFPLVTEWQVLYYRTDLFAAAGLKPPTTFAELEAAAKKLTDPSKDQYGIVSRGQGNPAVTQFSSYLYGYGGDFLKGGKAAVESPEFLAALKYYGGLLKNYGPPGVTGMSWAQGLSLFQAGKVAMWTDASTFLGQITDPAKSTVADKVGVAAFPAGPKGNKPYFVTAWAMSIAKQSRQKAAAYNFLTWATSKAMLTKALGQASVAVARNSPWSNPGILAAFDATQKQLAETASKTIPLATGYDRPLMTAVGAARDAIGPLIVTAIETGGTANQAAQAKKVAESLNELLDAAGELGK
ncbi:MAG: sugar ABC transporter substrate-binding protein [Spirochaetales bacterium]|nr:sugar ABC transporter substrate-binding protein [Spirochaetales bacterium]